MKRCSCSSRWTSESRFNFVKHSVLLTQLRSSKPNSHQPFPQSAQLDSRFTVPSGVRVRAEISRWLSSSKKALRITPAGFAEAQGGAD